MSRWLLAELLLQACDLCTTRHFRSRERRVGGSLVPLIPLCYVKLLHFLCQSHQRATRFSLCWWVYIRLYKEAMLDTLSVRAPPQNSCLHHAQRQAGRYCQSKAHQSTDHFFFEQYLLSIPEKWITPDWILIALESWPGRPWQATWEGGEGAFSRLFKHVFPGKHCIVVHCFLLRQLDLSKGLFDYIYFFLTI